MAGNVEKDLDFINLVEVAAQVSHRKSSMLIQEIQVQVAHGELSQQSPSCHHHDLASLAPVFSVLLLAHVC